MAKHTPWTEKDAAEKRRLDRKILGGNATRNQVMRALDLRNKQQAATGKLFQQAGEVT
jgi:hypothetical protein